MVYLITHIDPSDEFDNTCYGILQVTQDLIDRLRIYSSITNATPMAKYVVFEEDCFEFADSDLEIAFPEIALSIASLREDESFRTILDLSSEILHDQMEMPEANCHAVRVYGNTKDFTFFAFNEYNSVEYWFQVTLENLENALKELG
jgi:hypothetical protein